MQWKKMCFFIKTNLSLDNEKIRGMENLKEAMLSNGPNSIKCPKCMKNVAIDRVFGDHLFVDVSVFCMMSFIFI